MNKHITLCKPGKIPVCVLNGVDISTVDYAQKFNDLDEITFSVDKHITSDDGKRIVSSGYDMLHAFMEIYVEDIGYFQIKEPEISNEINKETKTVTGISIATELLQKDLVGFTVNTSTAASLEMLADNNINSLGYPNEYISFYNPKNKQLSLMDLILEKAVGWRVGEVDDFLKNKKFSFDNVNENIFSFLTKTLSSTARCIFEFDTINKTVSAYSENHIGNDTGVIISERNLLNSVDVQCDSDNIYTRLNVQGKDSLNFADINYGDTHIFNLDYYSKLDYMDQDLIDALEIWQRIRNNNRAGYIDKVKTYQSYLEQISEIDNKIPTNGVLNNWDNMSMDELTKNLTYYNSLIKEFQIAAQNTHPKTGETEYTGNLDDYTPSRLKSDGTVDHDSYMNDLDGQGKETYREVIEYVIPNIEIAIENFDLTKDNKKDYFEDYLTDWSLYGLVELKAKKSSYEDQLNTLKSYGKEWSALTEGEKASHGNNEITYTQYHDEYTKINGYLLEIEDRYSELSREKETLTNAKDSISSELETIRKDMSITGSGFPDTGDIYTRKNWFTDEQIEILTLLFHDTDYTNENILTTKLDDFEKKLEIEQELYEDAESELAELSVPQYTFSCSLDNLLSMDEFSCWHGDFKIGNFVTLEVSKGVFTKLRLININYNPFVKNNDLTIQFSNMITGKDGRNDFSYIFDKAISAAKNSITYSNNSNKDSIELSTELLNLLSGSSVFMGKFDNLELKNITANEAQIVKLTADYAKIGELDAKYATIENLNVISETVKTLNANVANIDKVYAKTADIDNLVANTATIKSISSTYAKIETLNSDYIKANDIKATYATIESLNATNGEITNLKAEKVDVSDLEASYIKASEISASYVKSDVADIGILFNRVGLITSAVIKDGHITGYLDAVEINANNITAGTLVADRILLKSENGKNGLLYSINNLGELTSENIDTLDGYILTDRTINADKIVAGSITANEIAVGTITASCLNATDIYASKAFIDAVSANSLVVGASADAANALSKVNDSIEGITIHYLATSASSDVTTSTSGWTTTVQTITEEKKYLWTYQTITKVDGTKINTNPVISGAYGNKGLQGATGISVSEVKVLYYCSNSSVVPAKPTSTVTTTSTSVGIWSTVQPTLNKTSCYVYTCTQTKLSNNTYIWSDVTIDRDLSQMAKWCSANDITYIDGGRIYAGSITADQIAAGTLTIKSFGEEAINSICSTANSRLVVGGRNILRNTNDMSKWQKAVVIKIGTDSEGYSEAVFDSDDTAWHSLNAKPNIPYSQIRGKQITLSFEYKADTNWESTAKAFLVTLNLAATESATGRVKYTEPLNGNYLSPTTQWQKYHVTLNVSDSIFSGGTGTADFDNVFFNMGIYRNNACHLHIRKPKVEIGTCATDWTPAPEDTDSKISEVKQTADKISWLIKSESSSSSLVLTDNTLTAIANNIRLKGDVITSGAIKSENYQANVLGTKLSLSDGSWDSKNFKVDKEGSITSTGGTIGGWDIGSDYLFHSFGTSSTGTEPRGVYINTKLSASSSDGTTYTTPKGKVIAINAPIDEQRNSQTTWTDGATYINADGSIYSSNTNENATDTFSLSKSTVLLTRHNSDKDIGCRMTGRDIQFCSGEKLATVGTRMGYDSDNDRGYIDLYSGGTVKGNIYATSSGITIKPTTSNNGSLGTSTLYFSTAYINTVNARITKGASKIISGHLNFKANIQNGFTVQAQAGKTVVTIIIAPAATNLTSDIYIKTFLLNSTAQEYTVIQQGQDNAFKISISSDNKITINPSKSTHLQTYYDVTFIYSTE